MAATFDSHFQKGAGSQANLSFVSNAGDVTGTVGGTNRVLIAALTATSDTGSMGTVGITWNGVAMTSIGSLNATGGVSHAMYLFGLINPATGNQTLASTYTGAHDISLGAICIKDAHQTTAWNNFTSTTGTSTSASLAVTSTSGDMVFCARGDSNASSASISSGTQDWDERDLNGNYGGGRNPSSGASATVAWTLGTSVYWGMVGVNVLQAAAGGSTVSADVGTLVINGQSPTVTGGTLTANAGSGALVINGQVPVVTGGTLTIAPGVGSLVIDGQVPTIVGGGVSASPDAGALVINGQTPAVTGGTLTVSADAGALVINGQVPVITGGTLNISPGASSLIIDGQQPTASISGDDVVVYARSQSNYVNLSWATAVGATGYEIGYDTNTGDPYANVLDVGNVTEYLLKPGPGYWYLNIRSYDGGGSGAWGTEIEWESGGLIIVGQTPKLSQNINNSVASLVINGQQPTLVVTNNISVGVASLVINGQVPTLTATGNVVKDVSAATLVIGGQAPTVTGGEVGSRSIDVDVAALSIAGKVPTVTGGNINIYIGYPSPTIWDGGGTQWDNGGTQWDVPNVTTIYLDGQQPAVTGGTLNIAPGVSSLIINGQQPTATIGVSIPSVDYGSPGAGRGSRKGDKKRRKRQRWILPDGTHVVGTAAEVQQVAEVLLQRPVVVRERKPRKPVVLKFDDGNIEPEVILPQPERKTEPDAGPNWIEAAAIMAQLETIRIARERKRRAAAILLLS